MKAKTLVESEYREALDRLRSGNPVRLAVGALITAANVAREAGRHPTALKRDRSPELFREIEYIQKVAASVLPARTRSLTSQLDGAREKNRFLAEQNARLVRKMSEIESEVLSSKMALLSMALSQSVTSGPSPVASMDKARRKRYIPPA